MTSTSFARLVCLCLCALLAACGNANVGERSSAVETKLPPYVAKVPDGPHFVVATIERQPFVIRTKDGLVGFSIDLWGEIAQRLGKDTRFELASSFPEMLDKVRNKEADAAIANITITAKREAEMDFSQPMFDAGLRVMIQDDASSVGLLGAIFNLEMLGLIALGFALLFGAANLMWYFEHRSQEYFRYPYKEGVFRSFWWSLNVILNGGFEERIPMTRWGRVFAVFLVFASLFVVSAFVAKITATLTVGELQSQIQGYADLYGKRVGTTKGSTAERFLAERSITTREFDSTEELFAELRSGQLDAVVHDAPLLQYYASNRGRGRVMVVGQMLQPEKYGIALQQGSDLSEPINRAILALREDGTFERIRRRWFERR